MNSNLSEAVEIFLQSSNLAEEEVVKTAGKEKLNRNKLSKLLERAKKDYNSAREITQDLETQLAVIQTRLAKSKENLQAAKSDIKRYHGALEKMDITNSDGVLFGAEDDCSYIIDNKEFKIKDDQGEYSLIPISQYRKEKRDANKVEDKKEEEVPVDELHIDQESPDSPDLLSFLKDLDIE